MSTLPLAVLDAGNNRFLPGRRSVCIAMRKCHWSSAMNPGYLRCFPAPAQACVWRYPAGIASCHFGSRLLIAQQQLVLDCGRGADDLDPGFFERGNGGFFAACPHQCGTCRNFLVLRPCPECNITVRCESGRPRRNCLGGSGRFCWRWSLARGQRPDCPRGRPRC